MQRDIPFFPLPPHSGGAIPSRQGEVLSDMHAEEETHFALFLAYMRSGRRRIAEKQIAIVKCGKLHSTPSCGRTCKER